MPPKRSAATKRKAAAAEAKEEDASAATATAAAAAAAAGAAAEDPVGAAGGGTGSAAKRARSSAASASASASTSESASASASESASESAGAWSWAVHDGTLYEYTCGGDLRRYFAGATRVVAFDMDSTLIEPKSGAKFARNRSDWKWWDDSVPQAIARMTREDPGIRWAIFSNQAGIEKKNTKSDAISGKMTDLIKAIHKLGGPVAFPCFFAGATDRWRKPHSSMWDRMVELAGGKNAFPAKALYVGDAAGRKAGWQPGKKKDFSCSDRAFAANSGIDFQTPEEFFLGEAPVGKVKWSWGVLSDHDLKRYVAGAGGGAGAGAAAAGGGGDDAGDSLAALANVVRPDGGLSAVGKAPPAAEVVVFVGSPASGKSTLYRRFFAEGGHYEWINRDTLKTKPKCEKGARDALAAGKSVVVDNTNGNVDRTAYIDIAKEAGASVRCLWLQTPIALAKHLNTLREVTHGVRRVPDVAFNMFKSRFEEPTTDEGFASVDKIDFVPVFDDGKDVMTRELFLHMTG